jgi:arylsulfatase A-like enzyme
VRARFAFRQWSAGRYASAGKHIQRDFSGHDWFPTLLAVAGDPDVKQRLLTGWQVGGRTYKVPSLPSNRNALPIDERFVPRSISTVTTSCRI